MSLWGVVAYGCVRHTYLTELSGIFTKTAKIHHTHHLKSMFGVLNPQMNQRLSLLNLWELSFCRPELGVILSSGIENQGQMTAFLFC